MCGIAGIVTFNDDRSVDHRRLVELMCNTIRHRGPDDEAYFTDKSLSLGMTRLAILDLRKGLYPISNEKDTLCLFYNGEIYNHHELTDELSGLGHTFRTKTDAEAIVHAYEEWGESCFVRFNGMWAFALYDKEKTKLILARDHFGIKPLYFLKTNDLFLFSSEIRALLCLGLIKAEPNERIVYTYLTGGFVDLEEETFFRGIRRLMPGSCLAISNDEFRIHEFWRMPSISRTISPDGMDTAASELRDVFVDSVRRRLVSDVPVGSCLSGGLDSSAIACVISRLKEEDKESIGGKLQAFFAAYPDDSIDESNYATLVVSETESVMHSVFPTSADFWKDFPELVSTQEEPFGGTNIYSQWRVMQLARTNGVTVLLDGQGGDELLAGYHEYVGFYILSLIKRHRIILALSETIRSLDILIKLLPDVLIQRSSMRKITTTLNEAFAVKFSGSGAGRFRGAPDLSSLLWNDTEKFILPGLLRYEDKSSMHFSIETRLPFLDPRLAEYVASIPLNFKIRDGWTKSIFREAMRDILPNEIRLRRGKVAFATPKHRWLMELSGEMQSLFSSELKSSRFVKKQGILELLRTATERGVSRWEMEFLWRCLNLELWMRQFIPSAS